MHCSISNHGEDLESLIFSEKHAENLDIDPKIVPVLGIKRNQDTRLGESHGGVLGEEQPQVA